MGCRESRKSQDDLKTNKWELKTFQKQITKFSVSIKLSFIFLLCSSTVLILSNSVYKNKLLLVTHSSFLQTLIFWHFLQLQDPSHIFSTNTKQSDSNGIRNHNHLVRERTLNHLTSSAKWLSVQLRTKWLWVRIPLLSLELQIWYLFRARIFLTFRQTIECGFTLKLVRDMIITCRQSKIVTEKFQI